MAQAEDRRRIAMRLGVLQAGSVIVFAILASAFWFLQVVQHQKYDEMAENNHQRTLALRAPRGVLFDRNGTVLVENRHSFTISIVREHTKDINHTIETLSEVARLDPKAVRQIVDRHRAEPSYRPIVIVEDASLAQVAAITARRLDFELPDVLVEEVPTRKYPADELAAHLFGYVGEATDTQVVNGMTSGSIVGQAGVERVYNTMLKGEDGAKRVVVNSLGREIRTLEREEPTEGSRLQLTIDYDVQKAVEDGFKGLAASGITNAGAAVILDPKSGEVLAFASEPAFDPNAFASGIDRTTWASLTSDDLHPLNDRAIQGRYSPGSTFKMAVALAALEEGIITPEFTVHCTGSANFYGRTFKCWKRGGHGTIDLRHAIEQSCNVFFYTVGNMVGVDKINKWATLLGIGVKSGIDLPNEVTGLVPSTAWKQQKMHEKWYAGETISVSIGQGQVSVTPVSMAVYMATLANGGTRVTPHLLKAVDNGDGKGWVQVPPPPPQSKVDIDPDKLQAIKDGLYLVVNGAGTGHNAQLKGYDVSGKTGTAQSISLQGARGRTDRKFRDHGWFVFFAPRDNPQIAGVVFAENGLHGSNAALVAKHAMEVFFAKKEGRPLPQLLIKGVEGPAAPTDDPGIQPAATTPARTIAQVLPPGGQPAARPAAVSR
jgi:penicillin-binding protein 2